MKLNIKTLVLSLGLALSAWAQASQASSLYFSGPGPVNVGAVFTLDILANITESDLAGGYIDLGYDGTKLQINSVTLDAFWNFLPDGGSQTATGTQSQWTGISFNTNSFTFPSGPGIPIATLNLTALVAGNFNLDFLGSTVIFDSSITGGNLNPTFTAANITAVPVPTAVPIPPAVWLFASGLVGLVGIARRRSRGGK